MKSRHLFICTLASFATLASIHPQPAHAADASPIIVKAIAFSAQGGGKVTIHAQAQAASVACIHEWCTTGHWLEWTFDAPVAGDYQLALSCGGVTDTRRAFQLNGQPFKSAEAIKIPHTAGMMALKEFHVPGSFPLKQGKNILRITCLDENGLAVGQMHFTRAGQSISVDPASFSGQGGGKVQALISDAAGFLSVWDTKGHVIEWTVNAPAAGDYALTLGYATQDVPTRKLSVNGQSVPGLEAFTVPTTGGWRIWCSYQIPVKIPLKQGPNVVRITNVEDSLNVTTLCLSAPGKPDINVPAIHFTSETGGKIQVHAPVREYFDHWTHAGHWLEWKFKAPVAGAYICTLRYIPPFSTTSDREIQMNGVVVKGLERYDVPGARPSDFREINLPVAIPLRAGENTLKITNLDEGPLDLLEIRFAPAAATPPKP